MVGYHRVGWFRQVLASLALNCFTRGRRSFEVQSTHSTRCISKCFEDSLYFRTRKLSEITAMSESAGVATKTFLSILVIANVVGNTLVCVIIMRNRDMRYLKYGMEFPF